MKIGIYAFWGVNWDGSTLKALPSHARYIQKFLEKCEKVKLFTSVARESKATNSVEIVDPKLEVVVIPWNSYAVAFRNQYGLRNLLNKNIHDIDGMYVRLFDPCPWIVEAICRKRNVGVVFNLVGDPVAGIMDRADWTSFGKFVRRIAFEPERYLTHRAIRSHHLLVCGGALTEKYKKFHPSPEMVIESTLDRHEFFFREDSFSSGELKLLFVGFLRPCKNVEMLLRAVCILKSEGREVNLRIVGSGDPASYVDYLKSLVVELGIEALVTFVGYVPLGEKLLNEYRNAAIFVLPSNTEGAPRVFLEAAAQSLPIVTTDVGSARDLFVNEQSAMIVEVNDEIGFARAISQLADNKYLRRSCISSSFEMASMYSCDGFIEKVISRLRLESKKLYL